ncbi:MAG: Phage integrase, site-specific tyrosine recombinase [uncultured Acidimicrobiales bacterium]|uniref:Phage integrase, site-specific tyrosine recombinase n=1 Tax=uncultured Acidimicrobiales bacterium TaxID=310071 RepID=A0A6J4IH20_9ACTN|nr:MAG: Phage integrase, site-specific tyrosine recombinase [uncultured Acidimicrobiales bacterium]
MRRVAIRTRDLYRGIYDCHLLPAFGGKALAKVTREDVRSWWATTADKVSPTVAARAYRVLAAIYATALEDGKVQATPCTIKGGGQEHTAERPLLSPAQVLDVADRIEPRYRAVVLLAGLGGLRLGELLYLQRQHVDLLHRTVTVEGQLVDRPNGERVRTHPKSKAGKRVVSIDPTTAAALEVQLATWSGSGPDGAVFTDEAGEVPTRTTLGQRWREAARSAGLPHGVHFHDLRHAAGTLAAHAGATTKELMSRIGHASPQAALCYQHAAEERDQVVADKIGALVAAAGPPTAPVVPLNRASREPAAG